MFKMGEVRVGGCGSELQVGRHSGGVFSISCNLKVFCAFSLGSPHRGDSEEHTQYTIFNKKVTLHHPIAVGAINVRAAEDLLHIHTNFSLSQIFRFVLSSKYKLRFSCDESRRLFI